jgi:DNA primase
VEIAVSFGLELRDCGKYYSCTCPFHEESDASFCIYKDTQRFHCYGCKENGDVITFVRKMRGWGFKKALDFLNIDYRKMKMIGSKKGMLDTIVEEEKKGVNVKEKYGEELIDKLLQAEIRRLTNGI